jgi:hypothetical protein
MIRRPNHEILREAIRIAADSLEKRIRADPITLGQILIEQETDSANEADSSLEWGKRRGPVRRGLWHVGRHVELAGPNLHRTARLRHSSNYFM